MANVRLLMLNYEFPPIGGGGGRAHLSLLKQYAAWEQMGVDVLTSGPKPGSTTEELSGNVTIHRVGISKKDLHVWRRAEVLEWLRRAKRPYRRMLGEQRYDLVHAFFGFPTGWLCCRTAGRVPYVISLRGSDVPGGNTRLQLEYKILGPLVFKPIWKKAAALVACSAGLRKRALQFLPEAEIAVIPNGVDLEQFHPAATPPGGARGAADRKEVRLVTVGRFSGTKRFPLLVEAVRRLRDQGCRATLTVVGGGGLWTQLEGLVKQENLHAVVELTGRVEAEAMPEMYRRHDLFVSASMQEGMSNAMLEAMASGLPIVTTRCEGVDELIADNGVVVETASAESLAAAVRSLAQDASRVARMRTAARMRAEHFTWRCAAEQYRDLYDNILVKRGTGTI